jgi:serine/threonine-protein kinase
MGVVYRATDTLLDRDIAIKMMVPQADDGTQQEIAARFLVEAKAAARIQSRHVAQVLQLGETPEGEVFIAMELLVGASLSKVLQKEGKLDPMRAVRIGRQIAKGMSAAHALGVVHRDLKPANVMLVTADGENEVVKILDFGVAKLTRDSDAKALTQTGALLGTLPFMAPEQILGKAVDARTDVYSLGVVLYRMLAGAPLYDAESLSDIVRHQVSTPAPAFHERAPDAVIPPSVESVVMRCLEKDPAARFQTMSDLEVALGRALMDATDTSSATVIRSKPRPEETLPTGTKLGDVIHPEGAISVSMKSEAGLVARPATSPVSPTVSMTPRKSGSGPAPAAPGSTMEAPPVTGPSLAVTQPQMLAVPPMTNPGARSRAAFVGLAAGLGIVVVGVLAVVLAVVLNQPAAIVEKPAVVEEKPPVVEEKPPVVEEKPPVVEERPPGVEEKPPVVVEEKPPVVEEKPPVVEEIVEEKPVKKKPVEKKPVEKKPVEKKPVEKKPAEPGFRRVLTKDGTP